MEILRFYTNMKFIKRTIFILFILFFCVGCDQATKSLAKQSLPKLEVIRLLNDTFRLQYTENPGAFLGLGTNISQKVRYWVFTILVGIFLSGLLIYQLLTIHLSKYQTMAMSLVLGGGFGNLIDRVYNNGQVIDFMNLGIGSIRNIGIYHDVFNYRRSKRYGTGKKKNKTYQFCRF